MRVYLSEIGEVDDNTDLWALFLSDAHGKTGLFAGQLMRELVERAPELRPRLNELMRRGLTSDDPAERAAALHGALQLPATELGNELEKLSLRHHDWLAGATSAAGRRVVSLSLFLELLEREPQGSQSAIRALEAARLVAPAEASRALVQLQPELAIAELLAALDSGRSDVIAALTKPLRYTSHFEDVVAAVGKRSLEGKRRFVDVAYEALGADQFPAAYDRWLELGRSLALSIDNPPPRPVQSEASERFDDLLKNAILPKP